VYFRAFLAEGHGTSKGAVGGGGGGDKVTKEKIKGFFWRQRKKFAFFLKKFFKTLF
jgi:hypothetical protein